MRYFVWCEISFKILFYTKPELIFFLVVVDFLKINQAWEIKVDEMSGTFRQKIL